METSEANSRVPFSDCEICNREMEDLFERTGGACGQIICEHEGNENEKEEILEPGEIKDDCYVMDGDNNSCITPAKKKKRNENSYSDFPFSLPENMRGQKVCNSLDFSQQVNRDKNMQKKKKKKKIFLL